jgi:hypothetical protein
MQLLLQSFFMVIFMTTFIIIVEYLMLVVSSYMLQVHCTAISIYMGTLIHHLLPTFVDFMSDKYYSCRNSWYFICDMELQPVH